MLNVTYNKRARVMPFPAKILDRLLSNRYAVLLVLMSTIFFFLALSALFTSTPSLSTPSVPVLEPSSSSSRTQDDGDRDRSSIAHSDSLSPFPPSKEDLQNEMSGAATSNVPAERPDEDKNNAPRPPMPLAINGGGVQLPSHRNMYTQLENKHIEAFAARSLRVHSRISTMLPESRPAQVYEIQAVLDYLEEAVKDIDTDYAAEAQRLLAAGRPALSNLLNVLHKDMDTARKKYRSLLHFTLSKSGPSGPVPLVDRDHSRENDPSPGRNDMNPPSRKLLQFHDTMSTSSLNSRDDTDKNVPAPSSTHIQPLSSNPFYPYQYCPHCGKYLGSDYDRLSCQHCHTILRR